MRNFWASIIFHSGTEKSADKINCNSQSNRNRCSNQANFMTRLFQGISNWSMQWHKKVKIIYLENIQFWGNKFKCRSYKAPTVKASDIVIFRQLMLVLITIKQMSSKIVWKLQFDIIIIMMIKIILVRLNIVILHHYRDDHIGCVRW